MSPQVRPNRATTTLLVLVLILALLAGGVAWVRPVEATTASAGTATTIAVTATTSLLFTPNTFEQVATNSSITVSFTDASALAHTFTIIGREGWVIPSSISATDFDNLVFGKSPAVVFNLNISGAGTESRIFTSPGPGWYEFVCTEPGHFASGMYGFVAFGMNLPGNLTVTSGTPGAGAALFIIIGTIVSLVVIALILGFIAGRREGSKHEMPPERLGYPEPPSPSEPLPSPAEPPPHR